jgi:hypothetical protein
MKKLFLLLLPLVLFSCQEKKKSPVPFDEAFAPYVAAYTSGIISGHKDISIVVDFYCVDIPNLLFYKKT